MSVARLLDKLRGSLWFIPSLAVLAAVIASVALVELDRAAPQLSTRLPLIFGGGAEGARGMLNAIAGTMIGVAGVTFSITIVALQLASSQFSPRVLRNYLRDRANQLVLAAFIGTFTYSLLVLRTIRAASGGGDEFVPGVAVSVAIFLAVLAVGMLIYFIHHIASQLQVSAIVGSVGRETRELVARRRAPPGPPEGDPLEQPAGDPVPVPALRSGYLQTVDRPALVEAARRGALILRLEVRPGDWVQRGAPLFAVWGVERVDTELAERLDARIGLGEARSMEEDEAFGVQQLVDVAVKALSPGINDPTTAIACIAGIVDVLAEVGRRAQPSARHADANGVLRLVAPEHDFAGLVRIGFDELRHFAAEQPRVILRLAEALETLSAAVPEVHHRALAEQASLLVAAAGRIPGPPDRDRVRARLDRLVERLDAAAPVSSSDGRGPARPPQA